MEYIKSLSVAQKLALIVGPIVAINFELFGLSFREIVIPKFWGEETLYYFCVLAICVATYFLFPQKQQGD